MHNSRFTLAHRLIHWAIALVFLGMLLTVWLRMDWMNKDNIADILINKLGELNISLGREDAETIGKAIRKPMWDWHIYLGYTLIGLYIIRLIIMKIQGVPFTNPLKRGTSYGDRFKSWVYIIFYVCVGISLFTGAMIKLGPKGETKDIMEEIHVQSIYYALAFVILHLAGLILGEFGKHTGIVSKMINGQKTV